MIQHSLFIGSTNQCKTDGVFSGFCQVSGCKPAAVQKIAANSGVPGQPIGLKETIAGAKNRMQNALPGVYFRDAAEIFYGIGVENGLVTGEELGEEYSREHWYDIAVVAVRVFKHHCSYSYVAYADPLCIPNSGSEGILSPSNPLSLEKKLASYSEIIMPIIREGKDMYSHFSAGKTSRMGAIQKATFAAATSWTTPMS